VPIIGPSGRWQNVTIATGHAMIGLSLGLGTGRVVAQLVAGEPPEIDLDRFSLARFS
jgi:D-amino-acid dehydrogenase